MSGLTEIDSDELVELRRKAGLWDCLEFAKAAALAAPDDSEWKRLATEGRAIEAVKVCRAVLGCGLMEAKGAVESFLGKRL